jgi:hypothetical protein
MKTTDFQYTFESAVSYDEGETIVPVTVAYDYLPEEVNYPHAPDYAEMFDVFVFDASGKDITYDIPKEETERLLDEAKEDFKQVVEAANAY